MYSVTNLHMNFMLLAKHSWQHVLIMFLSSDTGSNRKGFAMTMYECDVILPEISFPHIFNTFEKRSTKRIHKSQLQT